MKDIGLQPTADQESTAEVSVTDISSAHAICTGNKLIEKQRVLLQALTGNTRRQIWQLVHAFPLAMCYRHMISKQCQHRTIACRGINRQCPKRGTQVAVKKDYKLKEKLKSCEISFRVRDLNPGLSGESRVS